MINEKLEHAIVIGPHLVRARQVGSNERSCDQGNQRSAANNPSFEFPAVEHCQGWFMVRLDGFSSPLWVFASNTNPHYMIVGLNQNSPAQATPQRDQRAVGAAKRSIRFCPHLFPFLR